MQSRDLPVEYVHTHHIGTQILPLVTLFPLVITVCVFVGITLTGNTSIAEWRVPLIAIGMMSLSAFCISLFFERLIRWRTIRQIKQIYVDAWAIWIQYPDTDKWQHFIEDDYRKAMGEVSFSFAPIIIVGVVVTIIGGAMVVNGVDISAIFGLVGFMLIVIAVIVGEWLKNKWSINSQYQRRKVNSVPAILISPTGYYDEDQGYSSLKGLQAIEFKHTNKKSHAKINFIIKARWYELLDEDYGHLHNKWRMSITVPKGYEIEAEDLVQRFQFEVLMRK